MLNIKLINYRKHDKCIINNITRIIYSSSTVSQNEYYLIEIYASMSYKYIFLYFLSIDKVM